MAIHDTFPNLRTLKLSRLGQSATSIVPYLIYCNHYLEVLEVSVDISVIIFY